jgi:Abnormal spindle-like microcephaly-assoc'd, ASPM-SPD-2-Hydin
LFYYEFEFFDIVGLGRLIGFVGTDPYQGQWGNGSFFPQTSGYVSVGSGQTFIAPYAGELWLGFSDDAVGFNVGDNSGQVMATITVGGSDATAPAIAITTPTTVYILNQKVSAKYSCTDPDDAVASCAGPVANGARVDTTYGGPHAFTVVAADSHGNSSSKTAVYIVADVGLAPQSLAYPPQFVGTTSPAQRVMLFNRQSVPLNISGIGTSGSFSKTTTTCSGVLAAHASCSISVTFNPTATGGSQGSLNVSADAGSPSIILVGFGTLVKLSPPKVAFASQTVGTTSAAKNVTLKNAQTVTLNVSSINVSGDFALAPSTTCPTSGAVSAGKNCIIAITFTPTATGTRTGTLIVQADYPTAPVVIQLSGTGTP